MIDLDKLSAALEGLPPNVKRAVIVMRFQRKTAAEAAAQLGVSRGYVNRLCARGLDEIQRKLAE